MTLEMTPQTKPETAHMSTAESMLLDRDVEKILEAYELAEECDKEFILAHYEGLIQQKTQ